MDLQPLVAPRSIAIVGASERPTVARTLIEALEQLGFTGAIYPVNPRYETVLNRKCYPALTDLPEAPDVAALCIPGTGALEHIERLAQRGGKAAVLYDTGFAELGEEGKRRQDAIAAICRDAGIAMCGPNCMGILNPHARATTYKQDVQETAGLAGNVALVSHSGSICIGMLSDVRRYGYSLVVSAGNEAVTGVARYIDWLVDDPNTRIIATFTEAIREPERYVAALDRAAAAGKPVVVLKVGRSARAHAAVTSHTGGLAGEARVFSEVLRAHRAIEVQDLDEMTEVLAVCQGQRWPKGPRIGVVTGSGGQCELMLDATAAAGIDLPALSAEERSEVASVIGHFTGDGNPLDGWGNGNFTVNIPHSLAVLAESPRIDAVVYCNDANDGQLLGKPDRALANAKLLITAAAKSDKPHYHMNMRPGLMSTLQVKALGQAGLVTIGGTRQGLGAIARLGRRAKGRGAARPTPRLRSPGLGAMRGRRVVNEFDAKRLLAGYGMPVPRERLVATLEDARHAAREISYPVALKVVSDDIPHKTEHGLVRLALRDDEALASAWAELEVRLKAMVPRPSIAGYLVQEFVTGGVEVFAGIARDPDFGLSLAFGLGGVAIEVLEDFALRMLPLAEGEAEAMIAETRGSRLLDGFRGAPKADRAGLARCLYALSDFAVAEESRIAEIDLNPIKALPQGCVVLDALIVTK